MCSLNSFEKNERVKIQQTYQIKNIFLAIRLVLIQRPGLKSLISYIRPHPQPSLECPSRPSDLRTLRGRVLRVSPFPRRCPPPWRSRRPEMHLPVFLLLALVFSSFSAHSPPLRSTVVRISWGANERVPLPIFQRTWREWKKLNSCFAKVFEWAYLWALNAFGYVNEIQVLIAGITFLEFSWIYIVFFCYTIAFYVLINFCEKEIDGNRKMQVLFLGGAFLKLLL